MSAARGPAHLPTIPFMLLIIRSQPRPLAIYAVCHILFLVLEVVPGLIAKALFDDLGASAPAQVGLATLVALYLAIELARLATSFGEVWGDLTFRYRTGALVRGNMVAAVLRRPGALPLAVSSGEALSRFQDDVDEVTDFPLWLPDQLGHIFTAAIAVAIMARIDARLTLTLLVPLLIVPALSRLAWARILRYNRAGRQAAGAVSGFLGEVLGAAQAIKVADAAADSVRHLERLGDARRRAAVRARVFHGMLAALSQTTVAACIGLTILLAGQAMQARTFTVGDFALFVYYLWFTASLPAELGTFAGDFKQQQVAIERLEAVIAPRPPAELVEHRPLATDGALMPIAVRAIVPAERLEALEVRGLSYRHPGTGRGIEAIDLTVRRGELVVITGRVGSGKTTLLRALLGLLPRDGGEIRWNGRPVDDPAAWFRPPRCAYTPQVPMLFSDSLRENILLGLPDDPARLAEAVRLAVLEDDLAALPQGLDTPIGPRGVRLSGGQVQRAAATRMLIRDPELLVFDDLSSALDVQTEALLWDRLLAGSAEGGRPTCLAVSHRRAALARADRIVVLAGGTVESIGTLSALQKTSAELRRIISETASGTGGWR